MFVWYVSMFFWLDHHPTYLVISYVYVVSIPATTHRQVLRRELARAKTAVGSYAPWRTRPPCLGAKLIGHCQRCLYCNSSIDDEENFKRKPVVFVDESLQP